MFASRIVSKLIYETLSDVPELTAVVQDRIVRGVSYPQGIKLPACLFYMEQSAYDPGPVTTVRSEHLNKENMRFVIRLDDRGTTDTRIAAAAEAQLRALAGRSFDLDTGEEITFTAQGEVPLTTYAEGDQIYQRLGTIYSVEVIRKEQF